MKTMLEELGVQTVVVSDSDTSWVRDPSPYLAQHPTADWFISTDCLSAEVRPRCLLGLCTRALCSWVWKAGSGKASC